MLRRHISSLGDIIAEFDWGVFVLSCHADARTHSCAFQPIIRPCARDYNNSLFVAHHSGYETLIAPEYKVCKE